MKKNLTGKRNILQFLFLSLGATTSQLALIMIGLSDSIMMGRENSSGLAAGTWVTSVYNLALLFCMGMIIPIAYLLGKNRNGENRTEQKKIISGYIRLAIILTIMVTVFLLVTVKINGLIGKDKMVIALANSYALGLIPGIFPWILFYLMRNILLCYQKVKLTTCLSILSVGLNIFLNKIGIYGIGAFQGFGTIGCAIATSATNWIIFIILIYAVKKEKGIFPGKKTIFHEHDVYRKEIWKLGFPTGMVFFSEYLIFAVGNTMLSYISTESVIAFGIAVSWLNLSYMFPVGLSQVLTEQIAGYHAIGEKNKIEGLSKLSLWVVFLYSLACGAAILLFRKELIYTIMGNNGTQTIYQISEKFLFITVAVIVVYNMIVVLSGILRGFGDVKTPLVMMFIMYWGVGIGGTLILTWFFNEYGVLLGMLTGFFLTFVGVYSTYKKKKG